jgi:Ras and Rab interactor 2/3
VCAKFSPGVKLIASFSSLFLEQSVSVPRGMTSEDEGDDEGEDEDEDSCGQASSSGGGSMAPCGIGLVERLIRSHPVWFLAGLQRAGAVHLLQGKEEGVRDLCLFQFFL